MLFTLLLPVLTLSTLVSASVSVQVGHCSSDNNRLDPASKNFVSDCSDQTFCSGRDPTTSICVPRQCRRDEFPFGIAAGEDVPPLCQRGPFCPDDGSGCRTLVPAGSACELNRDEQCGAPPDWRDLASEQNFNGSICLRQLCMYANATLGDRCVTDNTTYIDVDFGGEQISSAVTRDNCQSPQLYCNPTDLVCEPTLPLNAPCRGDRQCSSLTCAAGKCANPPETPLRIAPWQSALTAAAILGAMLTTCILLNLLDKRHRLDRTRELRDYYYDQTSLRRSIIALHTAAADKSVDEKTSPY
ncbi:hypothetical protein FB45DRAFT_802703 [Roridomyces roridus]|uniref:Uncharacterized protein n=1 Tax=Roridomyces roridus TaxID=1738132 RepID=A0AAD7B912_9AGAR|nr:hypothetical protein FB45DRAFT_802703 [Roridomyces roridus]